jgi:hypothetical protein
MSYNFIFHSNIFEKKIRAKVIRDYLHAQSTDKCVCFSCGNSSAELRNVGLSVVEILKPNRWWTFNEIANEYKIFDATSGHLPFPLYVEIAKNIITFFGNNTPFKIDDKYDILAGSGETMLCMMLAYPLLQLTPVYDINSATEWNASAPLNCIIEIIKHKQK